MATFTIKMNSDYTLTVKHGRQVEHVGMADKTFDEISESVRWAAITMGAAVNKDAIEKILRAELGRR